MLIIFMGKIEYRECLSALATSFDDERHFVLITLPFFEIFLDFSFKHLFSNDL